MNKDVELIKSDGTYVKVKDIKNGTLLFTPSGKTVKVTNVNSKIDDVYKITPNKNKEMIVSGDYIMHLKFTNVGGIFWDENRKYCKARYILNLKIRDKCFGSKTYFAKHKNHEEAKLKCYNDAI